ncbi:hypothetical protein [Leeuwenhoekiella marinoflava]|uniref:SPOR domain-containing protein n=2 Tax=Leeuwenhoekiella marinoflava TaxID=988 RepID=A0A4Q0PST0_9FLAO|nr:hypothetical protein [Leeuwenhoekiella marinoflava]RXG33035.1 hypothetical protein DSL99_128 [Leeuwenhoekiella marinoflava]SHE36214.1 hypothetical protein SAMN02745246_00187 [Leeuwenhoekiella marinoflava DSM 3653]
MYFRLLAFFFLVSGSCFCQRESFRRVNEHYLKGGTRVIGNTILSEHPTKLYVHPKGLNDRTDMVYVDIDADSDTFSSSTASLDIPVDAKIKYAGLYWAATYPGAKGKQKTRGNRIVYDIKKKRNRPFDLVKLQFPGSDGYTQVQGEVIYDGMRDAVIELKNTAPYVCYSDITDLLISKNATSGAYTLANVTALEGYMYGGSSAGWMLYLIYEDEAEPLQYFTGYHGFSFIKPDNIQELDFKNFRAVESGAVKTSVTLAALEGDLILSGDGVSVFKEDTEEYIPLKSSVRYANNFFNSSITINDKKYINRVPANLNTLGFDLAKVQIPNKNNEVISNDAKQVKLQFKTESDRLFVFFSAFQTEISTDYYQRVVVEGKPDTIVKAAQEKIAEEIRHKKLTPQEDVQLYGKDGERLKEKAVISKSGDRILEDSRSQDLKDMLSASSIQVPDMNSGYYVVNHVFSKRSYALKWKEKMQLKGLSPVRFVNPVNDYHYIYLDYGENPDALYERLLEYRKLDDLEEAWILKVNLD